MATYLGYNFDPELFLLNWQAAVDPTLTALYDSGAVQANGTIQSLIANGSDLYTIPFYNVLSGTAQNYDGATTITPNTTSGSAQSGIVYGRAAAWKESQFVRDYNSGADPMAQITAQTAKYYQKLRQSIMLKVLSGVFGVSNTEWNKHTMNIATTGSTVADANKVGAASAAECVQKAVGDNAGIFSTAVMHSAVALSLAKENLLSFRKYTDAQGIERQLNLADWNGMTVVVDDGVPTKTSSSASGATEYTTYLFGTGALQYAKAPVEVPVETVRDALTNGGENVLVTRVRETIHPNGFSFAKPSGYAGSPTDAHLAAAANWSMVGDAKNIAIARLITNG